MEVTGAEARREILAIMAKAPRAGFSKTRLIPALGPEGAAQVAAAMLTDTIALCRRVAESRPSTTVEICFAPDDGEDEMRAIAPDNRSFRPQRGTSLGQRLTAAIDELFAAGADAVVIIGADSPTLAAPVIAEAFDRLERGADVVIGPTRDGGYYLIGLRNPTTALFVAVPWSTSRVLAATLERAAAKGLSVELLPRWYDIDEPVDLEHFTSLDASGCDSAPATRSALARLRREPTDHNEIPKR